MARFAQHRPHRRFVSRFGYRFEIGVERLRDHGTSVDRNDGVRPLTVESERRRIGAIVHDERHLVAVGARRLHADRRPHVYGVQTADALERLANDALFPGELGRIGKMLHLTPAAGAEDWAEWLRALRRRLEDLDEIGYRVALFDGSDFDAGTLAGQRSEAKDDDAAGTADSLTVGEQIGECELEFDADPERRSGVRRSLFARQAP